MTEGSARGVIPEARLDALVAVVTGASRGIGKACALALGEAGAKVVLVSRTEAELQSLAEEIAQGGGEAAVLTCDVADPAEIAERIGGLDRIDVLVNNAGLMVPENFLEATEEALDRTLALNVKGCFLVAQAAARRMAANGNGGAIINMSSQSGLVAARNRATYVTSKHAVEGMTKAMALDLAVHNIRVNSVCPTTIETDLNRHLLADPEYRASTVARIPLGRIGTPGDVAAAVVFLASPAAAMITGTSLLIDGGGTAQ